MKHFKATKQLFLFTLINVYAFTVNAKSIDFTGISPVIFHTKLFIDTVPSTESQSTSIQNSLRLNDKEDTAVENWLIQLALNQPNYTQTLSQQKIFDYQLKKQRNSWLNLLTISTNYNDQTFSKPSSGTTAYVYPKYFFGINIPLGLIVSNGTDVKITKESEKIAKDQQAELAKSIRATVLTNYKQYKANEKLLIIQNQAVDDEQANFLQVEQKFKNGTATLDAYNSASSKYNAELVKVINLQLQLDLIKVELERLTGIKLGDILK